MGKISKLLTCLLISGGLLTLAAGNCGGPTPPPPVTKFKATQVQIDSCKASGGNVIQKDDGCKGIIKAPLPDSCAAGSGDAFGCAGDSKLEEVDFCECGATQCFNGSAGKCEKFPCSRFNTNIVQCDATQGCFSTPSVSVCTEKLASCAAYTPVFTDKTKLAAVCAKAGCTFNVDKCEEKSAAASCKLATAAEAKVNCASLDEVGGCDGDPQSDPESFFCKKGGTPAGKCQDKTAAELTAAENGLPAAKKCATAADATDCKNYGKYFAHCTWK